MNKAIGAGSALRQMAKLTGALAIVTAMLFSPNAAASPGLQGKAEPRDLRRFTCPIGGKAFRQEVGYQTLPLVTLPDGSWLGDHEIDVQIPSCPDNGLVILPDYTAMAEQHSNAMLYRGYTPAEMARLPALIADPAYVALKADGRHAQAWWLATQLGASASDRFALLQRATWAATDLSLRRRLVERLIAEGPALIDAADAREEMKRSWRNYIVNGLRELGRFDDALALLETLEAGTAPDRGDQSSDLEFAAQMRLAIAEKDDGRFPVELLSSRIVNPVCDGTLVAPYNQRTPATLAACKTRRERETRLAAEDEAAFDEAADLERKPGELAARCIATPEGERRGGLALACESWQQERDEAAADELVRNGPELAAACDGTPETGRKGPLFHACLSYSAAIESALGNAIADDEAAWSILCPGGGEALIEARSARVSGGCRRAASQREEGEIDAMLVDPARIDAQCKATPADEQHGLLPSACLKRERQKEDARIAQLASNETLFARDCRRFDPEAKAGASGDDDEGICRRAYNNRARAAGEAKGLVCRIEMIPDRIRCMTPAEHTADQAREMADPMTRRMRDGRYDEGSSLSAAARVRAAAIIAQAKADGTYPERQPGDRF